MSKIIKLQVIIMIITTIINHNQKIEIKKPLRILLTILKLIKIIIINIIPIIKGKLTKTQKILTLIIKIIIILIIILNNIKISKPLKCQMVNKEVKTIIQILRCKVNLLKL